MDWLNERSNIIPNEDDNLIELMELLEEIDENKVAATINTISFVGKDGKRIMF